MKHEIKVKRKKIKHEYVCLICGVPAEYNLQGGGWCLWSIDENGEYTEERKWGLGEGDKNEFYCTECAEKEGII